MPNTKQYSNPDELYRLYQETRDDIPAPVLAELMARAETHGHEDAIHSIVQAAKVVGNAPEEQASETKRSWLTLIFSKLSSLATPQLGTAFACLAILAVVVPMLLTNNKSHYPEVAHLSACPQCDSHISNATASTRSSTPGISRIDPETRIAAKLGIISARLKIESLANKEQALANALASLRKQPQKLLSTELTSLIEATPSLDTLSDALASNSQRPFVSKASEALFIANITVRSHNNASQEVMLDAVLNKAITALEKVPNPSILQQQTTANFKAEASKKKYDISLVNAIAAASKGLGG